MITDHRTKLYCPDSVIGDSVPSLDTSFWIDEQNVWNVACHVCGGEHHLDDMLKPMEGI